MFILDIPTLSLVTMIFSLIYFIGLLVFSKYNKRFRGFKNYAYANLALFSGFLLLGLRNYIPDFHRAYRETFGKGR